MGDRCTGHCCRRFYLPVGPNELKVDGPLRFVDGEMIADMAIFLEVSNVHANGHVGGPAGWWYTCRHLQPNGDCGVYERRPVMCREFPYGRPCQYTECTWDMGRLGLGGVPAEETLVQLARRALKECEQEADTHPPEPDGSLEARGNAATAGHLLVPALRSGSRTGGAD